MLASGPGVTRAPRARKPSAKLLAASEVLKEEQEAGPMGERQQDFSGDLGGRPTPPPQKRKRRSMGEGAPALKHVSRHASQRTEHIKLEHQLEAIEELEAWQATGSNSSSQESFDIKDAEHAAFRRYLVQHPGPMKADLAAAAKHGKPCRRKQKHPLRSPFS